MRDYYETFKQGRAAGQADVALEVLRAPPYKAQIIARQFLMSLPGYDATTIQELIDERCDGKTACLLCDIVDGKAKCRRLRS